MIDVNFHLQTEAADVVMKWKWLLRLPPLLFVDSKRNDKGRMHCGNNFTQSRFHLHTKQCGGGQYRGERLKVVFTLSSAV